ncbi:hypothetical protein KSP39_PZI022723 [Platanthera zijinensis]|uniref:Homoserine dehydrogenase n=1 Tax=Platanthera zijinensis TaxID=2320716 RepID=A0AAP0AWB8_9ASPA
MKIIPVLLLGCGGVGRQLIDHIVACRSLHSKQGLAIRVVGIGDSRSLIVVKDVFNMELEDAFLKEICRIKSSGSSLSSLTDLGQSQIFKDSEAIKKIIDSASLLGRSTGLVLVDCSASLETIEVLKQAICHGGCVVLANKKPLTSKIVGAGLPVIASVTRVLSSGDSICRIIGSLSGTLGYVMSELEDGRLFSSVVQEAKRLGYTEPDPRDDLSGMDVARKALILARLLGQRINLEDIKVDSLYPNDMGPKSMPMDEFMSHGLPLLDRDVGERIEVAASKRNVLRYVCVVEGSRCQVGLQELPKDSPLGRLRGSDNVPLQVELYSRCYKAAPLVIQGAGAGNDSTAAGVLADIVDLQDLFALKDSPFKGEQR